MQRTGGTSLAGLLMAMSEHRSAEHEPFNWAKKQPRQFWPITEAWLKTRDEAALHASLERIFAERYLIKHCYEILQTPINTALMQVAAKTPYRHVILLRRDEPSRLVSKFIAEAQGTWFTEYARKVYSEVASGNRQLQPLPIDKIIAHYKHCQQATQYIVDTLSGLDVDLLPVFYEDLYAGTREERLTHLHRLVDFLGFTARDLQTHHDLLQHKIFDRGQGTPLVASHLPNLKQVLEALDDAGCNVADSALLRADREPVTTAPDRMADECTALLEAHGAVGPYLEISSYPPDRAILKDPRFSEQDCAFVRVDEGHQTNGAAGSNDMRALFTEGRFKTVLWVGALEQDRFFWRTLDEIKRVLAPGGTLVVVSSSFGKGGAQSGVKITGAKGNTIADATITRRVHSQTDYWRISPKSVREVILEGMEVREVKVMMMPPRVFGLARKPVDIGQGGA